MKKFLSLIFFAIIVSSSVAYSEDIQVTSTFNKRQVAVNEEVSLTINIAGAKGNIQAPRLPSFQGFDTFYTGRASHLTFINGQSSSNVQFSYVLVPKTAGTFNLGPIDITIDGRNFRTDPVQIEVTGAGSSGSASQRSGGFTPPPQQQRPYTPPQSSSPPQDEPPPTFQPADDNIFVRAWVDKQSVYPNQQVLLTYSLYTRYDTRYEGFEEEPQISGFWIEEFPMEREIKRETVRVNGKRYVKADIKKVALFPQSATDYTINPGSVKASIRQEPENTSVFDEFFNDSFFSGGSFFARRENRLLSPPPISIQVKPLPEAGKPAGFGGAVGNFRMTATVDKASVKQNEPVTMKLMIEGEGNIETLNKPKIPEIPGFKIYDADTSSNMFKTGDVIGGRKTFEIVFIPLKSGQMKIPALEFNYFSPASAAYQKLLTPEFPLSVAPSEQTFQLPKELSQDDAFKKKIEIESKDIRFIGETLPDEERESMLGLVNHGLFVLDGVLLLFILAGLYRRRQEKIFQKDSALKRRSHARTVADGRIRKLKKPGRNAESTAMNAYFEDVDKILTQYLADKFNLSAFGITRGAIQSKLAEVIGETDSLFKEIDEFYQICDESRFGAGKVPEDIQEKALKILKSALSRLEHVKVKK